MIQGSIKHFNKERGFGFITDDDGEDIFFHITDVSLPEGAFPEKGQRVAFVVKHTGKGPAAVLVELI